MNGPTQVPGWVLRFNDALDRIYLVLKVNAVWWLLTLLGLGVLGIAPASAAAADAYISGREGDRVRVWRTMWGSYRSQFLRANARLLPFLAVQGGALVMLRIVLGGGAGGQVMTAVLATLAAVSLLGRRDERLLDELDTTPGTGTDSAADPGPRHGG